MKLALPHQIPVCGRRSPAFGALAGAMKVHQRPFVLLMDESNRHELVAVVTQLAERLSLMPLLFDAQDTKRLHQQLLTKSNDLIVIVESSSSRIPICTQELILDRYERPHDEEEEIYESMRAGATPQEIHEMRSLTHPCAGLLIITDTDPGHLLTKGFWTMDFTSLKHFSVSWDPMTRRPDAYHSVFMAGLFIAAEAENVADINKRVDLDALDRYARMQKILANHAKRAQERGMNLAAHQSTSEIFAAARDCVLFIKNSVVRRINTDVIEALVFKGVTEAALKQTFGLAESKKVRRM